MSFALLQLLWSEQFAGPMPELVVGIFGKPAFAGAGAAHFNISHDQTVCACVLAPVPVGVDLQSRVPFDEDLFDRIASRAELQLRDRLVALDDLSPLWTRKEAVVKRTGRGLTMPFQTIEALSAPGVLTMTCDDPDVRLSVSAAGRTTQDLLSDVRIRFLQPHSDPDDWSSVPGGARASLRRVRERPRLLSRSRHEGGRAGAPGVAGTDRQVLDDAPPMLPGLAAARGHQADGTQRPQSTATARAAHT